MLNKTNIRSLLSKIGPDSCPNKVNLHCHTTCSDGSLSPELLIKQAASNKLEHLAVTDHNTVSAYPLMQKWIAQHKCYYKLLPNLWTGIEINALLKKTLVHIIGLDFDITHLSMKSYIKGVSTSGDLLKAETVISAIHNAGGLAFLAHPARYRLSYQVLLVEAIKIGIDGAEAWYDYEYNSIWKPTKFICSSIDKLLKENSLLSTCGTDTHGFDLRKR